VGYTRGRVRMASDQRTDEKSYGKQGIVINCVGPNTAGAPVHPQWSHPRSCMPQDQDFDSSAWPLRAASDAVPPTHNDCRRSVECSANIRTRRSEKRSMTTEK